MPPAKKTEPKTEPKTEYVVEPAGVVAKPANQPVHMVSRVQFMVATAILEQPALGQITQSQFNIVDHGEYLIVTSLDPRLADRYTKIPVSACRAIDYKIRYATKEEE
jgi:hypothetical protein